MNFDAAVSEHLAWKQRLKRILLGRERRRIPERTEAIECRDCSLDHWLRTDAKALGNPELVAEIDRQHRAVHELAIRMVLAGEEGDDTLGMVFQIGQFHMSSRQLLESLELLRRRHGLAPKPLCVLEAGFPREARSGFPG